MLCLSSKRVQHLIELTRPSTGYATCTCRCVVRCSTRFALFELSPHKPLSLSHLPLGQLNQEDIAFLRLARLRLPLRLRLVPAAAAASTGSAASRGRVPGD